MNLPTLRARWRGLQAIEREPVCSCRRLRAYFQPKKSAEQINSPTPRTAGAGWLIVDSLIADHRGAFEVNAMNFGELQDHAGPGLAASASVGVVVPANLPARQDVAQLAIEPSH